MSDDGEAGPGADLTATPPAHPVRPRLIGLLAATAGLSGATLWWEPAPAVSAAADRPAGPMVAVAHAVPGPGPGLDPLPAALPPLLLPAMVQDPFADAAPGVAPPPPAAPPPPVVETAPPPPPPAAPPADYRYLGRFVGTDGASRHFLAQGSVHHELVIGRRLPDGYVVESVDAGSIRLRHAPSEAVARIPIPPAPEAAP